MPWTTSVPPKIVIVMSIENTIRVHVRTGYPRRFIHGSRDSDSIASFLLDHCP